MKIGIYTGTHFPNVGGAYTLIETIKKEIISSRCIHEIFIFFSDKSSQARFIIDRITYINIYTKPLPLLFSSRLKRKLLKIIGFNQLLKPTISLNNFAYDAGIDLLWLLVPCNFDLTIPYIFTVWDLGHRILPSFPEMSKGEIWKKREELFQKMLYRAVYIITGNEIGKREILANYSVNPEKIKIIPFPIPSFCFEKQENIKGEDIIKFPFIFYPAQFWPHKNHMSLIEAIAWLRNSKNIIINCYFIGSDKGNLQYINDTINSYHLENQIFILGFVKRGTLFYLYRNALAMTFVSLLGRNNLPPLEALSLGCPLIFSNIPGHLEQMGKTGIAVDAINPIEIGEAILSIYNNPKLRQKLISDGLQYGKKYKNYSYFEQMLKVIDYYELYRKRWA